MFLGHIGLLRNKPNNVSREFDIKRDEELLNKYLLNSLRDQRVLKKAI